MRLTKSKILSILLFLPCYLLQGQKLYYEYDNGANFVCISDDTLAFISPRGGYYYGNYSIEDTIIIPIKNILSNKNYTIDTVSCDSSNMELKVYYWEKPYYFGYSDNKNDTALYLENAERIGIYFGNNEFLVSDYNGIITMNSDKLNMFEDSLHFFVYVDGGLFRADVTIPIKLGVRYCITQKQYGMYPFLIDNSAYWFWPKIYYEKGRKKIVFQYGDQLKIVYTLVSQSCSCLEEIRKRYLDL